MLNKKNSINWCNNLNNKTYKSNQELIRRVFHDPVTRDLPKIAALNGLFSTFIAGQRHMYFACGTDKELLTGPVVEVRGNVYPESWLEKYGYTASLGPYASPKFYACRLPDPEGDYWHLTAHVTILHDIMQLAYFVKRYQMHDMEIPDFISMKKQAYEANLTSAAFTSKRIIHLNEQSMEKEREFLESIAAYEWPYGPKAAKGRTLRCGIHIFQATGFMTGDEDQPDYCFKNPGRWLRNFHDKRNMCLQSIVVTTNCAKFICREFDQRGMPYILASEMPFASAGDRLNRQVSETTGQADLYETVMNYETIFFADLNRGLLLYFKDKYSDSLFTEEEIAYGEMLYSTYTTQTSPGCYIALLDEEVLRGFRNFARAYQIKFGHVNAGWLKDSEAGSCNVAIITELVNMPLVQWFILSDDIVAYRSWYAVDNDAPEEFRYFDKLNPDRFLLNKRQWFDNGAAPHLETRMPDERYGTYYNDRDIVYLDYQDAPDRFKALKNNK